MNNKKSQLDNKKVFSFFLTAQRGTRTCCRKTVSDSSRHGRFLLRCFIFPLSFVLFCAKCVLISMRAFLKNRIKAAAAREESIRTVRERKTQATDSCCVIKREKTKESDF